MIPKQIPNQLADIHLKYEIFDGSYKKIHPYEELLDYYSKMLDRGSIVPYIKDGIVLGYFEVWKINFEQFGRIVCHDNFNQLDENTTDGKLAYVANVWINKEFRNSLVIKIMKNRFCNLCNKCDYYCGTAIRKTASQPIKVFKRADLKSNLFNPMEG